MKEKWSGYADYDPEWKAHAQNDFAIYFSRRYGEPVYRPKNIRFILLGKFQEHYPELNSEMFVEWINNCHDNGILDVLLRGKDNIYIDEWAFYHWVNGWPYPYNGTSKFRIDRECD